MVDYTKVTKENISQHVIDIIATKNEHGGIFLFGAFTGEEDGHEHMHLQLDALNQKLVQAGDGAIHHVNILELFKNSGKEYAIDEEALNALDVDRTHLVDLTEHITLPVHFLKWFKEKGLNLLVMSLPRFKKRIIITTSIVYRGFGEGTAFSWFKCDKLFFLTKITFFVSETKLAVVRCIVLPSGMEVNFVNKEGAENA